MDANYVMDETLGTTSFDITKLEVGQTKMESFRIGKVSVLISFIETDTCGKGTTAKLALNPYKWLPMLIWFTWKCAGTLGF